MDFGQVWRCSLSALTLSEDPFIHLYKHSIYHLLSACILSNGLCTLLVDKAKYWSHAVPSKSGHEFVSGMIHLSDLLRKCPSASLQPRQIGKLF